jgi:hypothetical protein
VASQIARRSGPRVAGLVVGFPVNALPILLVVAIEQGDGYSATAARAAVLGLVSLVGFALVFAAVPRGAGVAGALGGGWAAYAVGTLAFAFVHPPLAVNAVLALAAMAAGRRVLRAAPPAAARPRTGDLLPWRLLVTAALVLLVTTVAHGVSAHLAGLLSPLPIVASVLGGFTYARAGRAAAVELLGGIVAGLGAFLAFLVVLAATLGPLDRAPAFALATVAALVACAVSVRVG